MKGMVKQKMMNRFHKRNSSSASSVDFKSGERLDFKFSSLQALQVPSGWDKLTISLISIETDKTVTKTGKASVYNGNCRWTETLSESIWLSQEDASKELQQCLYKLLISKGSTRSSILGEATVNLSSYMSSDASLPIALPLKKCDHGTILQVAIQCLTPRPNSRWSDTNSIASDLDNISEAPNGFETKPIETPSNALDSRETSFATVRSHQSFDSIDSFGRESTHSNLSDVAIESTTTPTVNVYNSPSSGKNLLNRRQDSGKVSHNIPASPLRTFNSSSEYVIETEGDTNTIQELREEARTWERNARKLMVDLELSRKVTSDQTRNLDNVTMELSAVQRECNEMKNEIKHLKILLGESEVKERDADNLKVQVQDKNDTQKELEEEIKFQKDLNSDLSLQLNKTQESNLELVSVLQELEEQIEKQKLEIESLVESKQSEGDVENREEDTGVEVSRIIEKDKRILELELELKKFQETQEKLESTILYLEETLEEKTREIELERDIKTQTLLDIDSEWTKKLSLKDKEIFNLEGKLSEALAVPVLKETESRTIETPDLYEEIKALKEKVIELERDCNELTDENLELLYKLKDSSKDSEVDYSLKENNGKVDNLVVELKSKVEDLSKEIFTKNFEIEGLRSECLIKEEEIQSQSDVLKDLEGQLTDLQLVNSQLEESLKDMQKEDSTITDNKILEKKLLESEDNVLKLSKNLEDLEEQLSTMNDEIASKEKMFDSELETLHLQFTEENSSLKVQLEEIPLLQEEIVALKNSLNDVKHENERLEASLHEDVKVAPFLKETESQTIETSDLIEEIKSLKEKVIELEKDCNELTEENLDLLFKLKESSKDLSTSGTSINERPSTESPSFDDSEVDYNLKDNEGKLGNLIIELKSRIEELKEDCLLKEYKIQSQNDRVKELEGQLEKSLTDVTESTLLEAENLKSEVMKLQDEIERLEDMEKRWLESQEECEYLKRENTKLEATNKNLLEECSELREQRLELQNCCNDLEVKLRESEDNILNLSKKLEDLEEELSTKNDEITSKEKMFNSELQSLHVKFTEEKSTLEVKLQEIPVLQDKIVALKKSLNDVKFENEKVEASLQMISADYDQLKEEKFLLVEKLEDLKSKKLVMEEKISLLEGDLNGKEALGEKDDELKNEVESLKKSNSQLQCEINRLQEEKDKENVGPDTELLKIQSLEIELTEALEANEMYKKQLKSLLSEKEGRESEVKNEKQFEAELNELQERYLNMSLKYAEVEAQREELVLKLKGNGPGRSWFS